jgi:hypothetical protein
MCQVVCPSVEGERFKVPSSAYEKSNKLQGVSTLHEGVTEVKLGTEIRPFDTKHSNVPK